MTHRIEADGETGAEANADTDAATAHAWTALGGAPDLLEKVSYVPAGGVLPARLPVRELARATVGACSLAAAELAARRSGERSRPYGWRRPRSPPRSSASGICGSTAGSRRTSRRCQASGARPTAGCAPTPTTPTTAPACCPPSG
ncbi:hypothetical protein SAZ11_33670 [Streptomyces sp. FXJ1.4098]|nr:hypothetical protein [Streptomyces sp. FXJ1.4098]